MKIIEQIERSRRLKKERKVIYLGHSGTHFETERLSLKKDQGKIFIHSSHSGDFYFAKDLILSIWNEVKENKYFFTYQADNYISGIDLKH